MNFHIKISVSKSKFDKESLLAACCEMAESGHYYLLRKSGDGKYVDVLITISETAGTDVANPEALKAVAEQFKCALFEKHLQISVLKQNMKFIEEVVTNALSNPALFKEREPEPKIPESIARIIEGTSEQAEESYLDDVLQIAVPWEEKHK